MLPQDVERMPYKCLIVLGILVDESTMVNIQNIKIPVIGACKI